MPLLTIGLLGTSTITQSETDTVQLGGLSTLNITGPAGPPINVTLSSVAGVGLLNTINITNANVTLNGVAGVSALTAYNINAGGKLTLASTIGLSVGTTITFAQPGSRLVLGNGVDLSLLSGLSGFGPGSSIDVNQLAASVTYADSVGTNTGGVITLLNSGGQSVGTLTLLTGDFTAASFKLSPDATGGTIVGFTSLISVTASPATADLGVGQVVALTLATSGTVSVAGGTPTLTLNDGGVATYNAAASTSTSLVFNYTVSAGQNTADLAVTGVTLNGATVTDAAGDALNLAPAVVNPAGILQIDTTTPTLSLAVTTPNTGDLGIGQVVTFTVASSEAVTVAGGTPTLTLNDGGTATYNAGASTATSLVFNYTVAAGQNTADLTITATALNGATIVDGAGNAASLAATVGNPVGTLQIDTMAPILAAATTAPVSGAFGAGQVIAFTVASNEPLTIVGGTPTLTLNDGGTAAYNAGLSTSTSLVFTTIVAPGQNAADLAITAASLNGATVTDGAGNAAALTSLIGNPVGILQIDTTAPTVTGVTTSPGSGSAGIGQVVTFTVATSEAVSVAGGTPTLILNNGGTASYDAAASTPNSLAFTYTIAGGQSTADLTVVGTALNGAIVADPAGNAANLSGAVGNPPGVLQVDGTTPIIVSVTTNPLTGSFGTGQVILFTVATSQDVTVAGGTPSLSLNDGGTATYDAGASTLRSLVFSYTVTAGQNTADVTVTGTALNGATVVVGVTPVDLDAAIGNPAGILQVDTTAPTILGVATSPGSGTFGIGQVVNFTVATSEAVSVAGGTPSLTLNDGGTATYDAAASTATSLAFSYTVASGQDTADLAITAAALNGATVTDAAGNLADLSATIVNPSGILQIDTTAPILQAATTSPGAGALSGGQVVTFTVASNEALTIAGGTPSLTLNDGGIATYDATGSSPTNLQFQYTVAPGQNTADLTITGAGANGATVTDAAGNAADLSSLIGNPLGLLQIDTTAPTITGVTTSPSTGAAGIGQVITFTVTPSEAVSVTGGTPTLGLNNGGTATYDAGSSTPTSLAFSYTVAAGQDTADIAVTSAALNGAIIADPAGNAADLTGVIGNPAGVLQVNGTMPAIIGVTTAPISGSLGAGQVVVFTVATSQAVTVAGGTPTLTLNDGGTATYDAGASTATNLVFSYTVTAGQNIADLTVTAAAANGATITASGGNAVDITGAIGNPAGILQIDTTAPILTGVTTSPSTGSIGIGQVITFTVAANEAVIVAGGTPTLTLNDGGTATYNAGASTGTALAFSYTVAAGQSTGDLTVTAASLNGATIADAAGNLADLSIAVGNPPGTLQVDTTAPVLGAATTNPGTGDLGIGQVVTFTVASNEALTVAGGTPTLTLNDGGTASYVAGASTPTSLVFSTTVGAGQNAADLAITGAALNGATVTDAAGNAADLSSVVGNPAGILQIDTTAPLITAVTTSPNTGSAGLGQVITITVTPSENVTVVGGTPTLGLNNGGTATYDAAASSPGSLAFTYTVAAGQTTADLTVTAVALNGAVVADGAGNAANLAGVIGNPAGVLQVDGSTPTITSVTTAPTTGSFGSGQVIAFTVATSGPVTVAGGTPSLTLNDGGTATYNAAASTPTALVFDYTVATGQNTADLTVTAATANGATITDAGGNAVSLAMAVTNPAGILQIDTTAPILTGVTTSPGTGSIGVGQVITFTVAASEAVIVAGGTPTLTLNDGGIATYNAGASTATALAFTTTVAAGQSTADLTITAASLNGATIADAAGNLADLSIAVGNPPGTLQVDTTAPVLGAATTTPGTGDFGAGQVITFTVAANEALTVAGGTPTLILNDGGTASYVAGASTPTSLVFSYTVAAGQDTADLAITGAALNSATVTDAAGNAADLGSLVGNPAGVLQIDTTAPVITSVSTAPGTGTAGIGQVITFTVTPSENVTVVGGTPTLGLNNGGTATYDAAASSPGSLAFTYTIAAGQNTADLTVTAAALNGAVIADGAGNAADLAGLIGNPPGVLQVDGSTPTITSVTTAPTTGSFGTGQVIAFTVTTSAAVSVVGGTPSLTLNDGGTATYDAGASTATTLVFDYTVAAGQNTADLTVTAASANGAVITAGGNVVDLAGAVTNPAGILQIDTTAPILTSVTTSPGTGSIGIGQVITFTVAASEAVAVAGGTPTLTLDDGGVATYDAAASTPTSLVFDYTVAAGQNTADLTVVAAALNGATIADPAGNAADLSGLIGNNPPGVLQVDGSTPNVLSVTTAPTAGDLGTGQVVVFTVATSQAVSVAGGTPTLTLDDGGTATYDAASSTPTSLVFRYTVAAGQNTADLTVTAAAANGASIANADGNPIDLSATVGNPAGILQIDTTTPVITGVTTVPGSGDVGAGTVVTFTVATSEGVGVTGGTPTLGLNNGGTAIYAAAASTPTGLAFTYTVAAGQDTADLTVTAAALNGAVIADGAGNAADLTGAIGNPPGTLQTDTTAPTLTGITATPDTGTVGAGQPVTITVATSEPVTVAGGTPTLALSDGGTATYDPTASTPTGLAFVYTVAAGENAAALGITGAALNGATIADAAGNATNLNSVIGQPAGAVVVDTTPPTVGIAITSPANGIVGISDGVTFTITPSEAVTVAGGTPTLTLNNGGVAVYDPTASTPTGLAFKYAVSAGQNTADLTVIAAALNGATITDANGNTTGLGATVGNPVGILQVDATAPTVTGVSTSPTAGNIATGDVVLIAVGTTEATTVANGTPTLSLSNGGTATYTPGNSTPTNLVFSYTLPAGAPVPGQTTGDLSITGVALNGASVTDAGGNATDFSAAIGSPATTNNFAVLNTSTNNGFNTAGQTYSGPVSGLGHQYINISTQNLNITALVANTFIHSGSGTDAIDVSAVGGSNVLDGSTGSNFLVGGTGSDTFFVDDRVATSDIWSTVAGFHAGDAVTLYGVTAADFNLDWENNQGAAGYTGLTLHATAAAKPIASMTLTGYSGADLSNGRLTVSFGTDTASQSNYMYVRAN